jgi:hypothetical protein
MKLLSLALVSGILALGISSWATPPVLAFPDASAKEQKTTQDAETGFPYDLTKCDYDVTTCCLTLRVQKNSADVWADLDVTYNIRGGQKSDGYRYVGKTNVADYTCTDGEGKALVAKIDRRHGNNLVWFFPEKTSGSQRIIAHYRLPDLLQSENGKTTMDVPWAGVWRIPVQHFSVDVVFPEKTTPTVVSIAPSQYEYTQRKVDERWVVHQEQVPLKTRPYRLEFVSQTEESDAVTQEDKEEKAEMIPAPLERDTLEEEKSVPPGY